MNISLGKDDEGREWRITADKYQYLLQRFVTISEGEKTKGEEVWATEGYFTDLSKAVTFLHERLVRTSKASTLVELQKNSENVLRRLLGSLGLHSEIKVTLS